MEDPSEKFQSVRDYVDIKLCKSLNIFSPAALKSECTKQMIKKARDQLKLNDKQIRRIYEIMKLQIISGEEYNAFEKMVKHRLNIPARLSVCIMP